MLGYCPVGAGGSFYKTSWFARCQGTGKLNGREDSDKGIKPYLWDGEGVCGTIAATLEEASFLDSHKEVANGGDQRVSIVMAHSNSEEVPEHLHSLLEEDSTHLNYDQRRCLAGTLKEYEDVFARSSTYLGQTSNHQIWTVEARLESNKLFTYQLRARGGGGRR